MFKEIFKKNWLTTLVGVLLIAGALGDGILCATNGGNLIQCVQSAWSEIIAAVGFIAAKDALGANDAAANPKA